MHSHFYRKWFILTCISLSFFGCNRQKFEKPPSPPKKDLKTSTVNADGETVFANGLKWKDLKVGEGETLKQGERALVHYKGYLSDGTEFDSSYSRNQPFEANLKGGVIQGWILGLPEMKAGGVRRLVIPPELGYGSMARPKIPANSTLIFEVKLIQVLK